MKHCLMGILLKGSQKNLGWSRWKGLGYWQFFFKWEGRVNGDWGAEVGLVGRGSRPILWGQGFTVITF